MAEHRLKTGRYIYVRLGGIKVPSEFVSLVGWLNMVSVR